MDDLLKWLLLHDLDDGICNSMLTDSKVPSLLRNEPSEADHEKDATKPPVERITLSQNTPTPCSPGMLRHPHHIFFRRQPTSVFSTDEKMLNHEYRHERPTQVLERLKKRDPNASYTVRQVGRVVGLARSKAAPGGDRDESTEGELVSLREKLYLPVIELRKQLLEPVAGSSKTEYQVRRMTQKLVADGLLEERTASQGDSATVGSFPQELDGLEWIEGL